MFAIAAASAFIGAVSVVVSYRINRAARKDREMREHYAHLRAAENGSSHHHTPED